ncbi:MAG TPA: hypothetical protein VLH39_05150 [Magnetospirillaceae bacterium]|nr:hypothetical protein [Magnetospirillaceae bacterium]
MRSRPDTPRRPLYPLLRLGLFMVMVALSAPEPAARSLHGGGQPLDSIPENDDIRTRWMAGLIEAPRSRALAFSARTETNISGRWRLQVIRRPRAFYIAVSPDIGVLYGQGSWIIKRDFETGRFVQAKVFLRNDPNIFLRLYPFGERSQLDLVLYRGVVRHGIILPIPFRRLLTASLREIIEWTKDTVEWDLLSPVPGLYSDLRALAEGIRGNLGGLRFADDGALDESGRPVLIAGGAQTGLPGLNCSGFAKWVVDGMLKPVLGTYLTVASLKERHEEVRGSSFTEPLERIRDPFFGLDWAWNLGRAVSTALYPSRRFRVTDNDVRVTAFALMDRGGLEPSDGGPIYVPYPVRFETGGYRVDGLRPLLYILAVREPGNFYIAAFNRRMGRDVALRQYFHIALLFPYFEPTGEFRVAVFESAAETSLDAVLRRYPSDFAHLVRIPALPRFDPPALPDRAKPDP